MTGRRAASFPIARAGLLAGLVAFAAFAATPLRRESTLAFVPDEPFQRDGGVQYFYALAHKEPSPETANPDFAFLRALDESGRWAAQGEPLHVVMSRITYTVDKDVSFFTEARAKDPAWMNAVAPEFEVTQRPDGGFHAAKMPSNDFTIRFLDARAVAAQPADGGVARLVALLPDAGLPDSVVVQENFDFARVMGVRTGAWSVTWTAHLPLGPGRTRVHVVTLSALHHLPPFFLGGEKRVFKESVQGALDLIERLRAAALDGGVTR
ncbi:MAG: hypothetical protein AB1730_08595 [Myxococcota bacterium]|jgi:hypothetical protein